MPLDPSYPQARLAYMLEDASPSVVITSEELVEGVPEETLVLALDSAETVAVLAQEPEVNPRDAYRLGALLPDHPVYVLYTSGSTGQPKSVVGLHRGTLNRLTWMWQTYPFVPGEACCHKTSFNFVDSVWEIFGPLLQGIPLVLISSNDQEDVEVFLGLLSKHHVTRIVLVPSLLHTLMETSTDFRCALPCLKHWISSGESLSTSILEKFEDKLPEGFLGMLPN